MCLCRVLLCVCVCARALLGRVQILVWSTLQPERAGLTLVARQVSEFSVKKLVFAPFADSTDCVNLVSCGRNNIR